MVICLLPFILQPEQPWLDNKRLPGDIRLFKEILRQCMVLSFISQRSACFLGFFFEWRISPLYVFCLLPIHIKSKKLSNSG